MEERLYLILDSKGTPLANAVLESPLSSEVLQFRVLHDKVDTVMTHREVQLIGVDDGCPNKVGTIVRQRDDQIVVKPTAALGPAARENLRIPTDFQSVMYPVSGRWPGQKRLRAKDLSCGGIAFWSEIFLDEREVVELVLPVTDSPLIVRAKILRSLPNEGGQEPLYAAEFVDLIQDEEALIRKAVFSIQVSTAG